MVGGRVRSAKACERCRATKRRCQPPYPCRSCVRHGGQCVVRDKARPRRLLRDATVRPESSSPISESCCRTGLESHLISGSGSHRSDIHQAGLSVADPLDIISSLVRTIAQERYSYRLSYELIEPQLFSLRKTRTLDSLSRSSIIQSASRLTLSDIQQLLASLDQFRNAPIDLVDASELDSMIVTLFRDTQQSTKLGDIDINATDFRLDELAFLFAALAFGSSKVIDEQTSLAFLEISMTMSGDYVGEPTFKLALTLFLQHACVLRTGPSNRLRGLIVQAIQVSHDIGINRGFRTEDPLQTPRFYLILYFTDQYCAMTHNTAPCIKPDDYQPEIFEPLLQAYPQLERTVELVALNGQVLHRLHNSSRKYEDVSSLESDIGSICSRLWWPFRDDWHRSTRFDSRYTILVQIHTFWSRILLRAPFLLIKEHWLCSLSICLRASQMLLNIYFDIFGPAIKILAKAYPSLTDGDLKVRLGEATTMPLSWRQVRRITTSFYIIIYAFWQGEASEDEAGRACAHAALLLDFQRTRWGLSLDNTRKAIQSLATISQIQVRERLREMLSHDSEVYFDYILGSVQASEIRQEQPWRDSDLSTSACTPSQPAELMGRTEAAIPQWDTSIGEIAIPLFPEGPAFANWDYDSFLASYSKETIDFPQFEDLDTLP